MTSAAIAETGPHASVRVVQRVAYMAIGTGERRNALRSADWLLLQRRAEELTTRQDVDVVVLTGTGGAFCAGSDLREWQGADGGEVNRSFAYMESALQAVEAIPVPTIAVLRGDAAGGGCQLALACDLRMMAQSARIGMPILRFGLHCSPAFARRLSVQVGPARTRELLYSGRLVRAEVAVSYGLATHSVVDPDLDAESARLVQAIAQQPRSALVAAKRAVDLVEKPTSIDERPWEFSDPDELGRRVDSFVSGAFVAGVLPTHHVTE